MEKKPWKIMLLYPDGTKKIFDCVFETMQDAMKIAERIKFPMFSNYEIIIYQNEPIQP